MRIRRFIMFASAGVAASFYILGYMAVSRILDHAVREDARQSAAALAQVTFASMFQLMSTGWNRRQAESFLDAVRNASREKQTRVDIYRGAMVIADYGEIAQPPLDAALQETFMRGTPTVGAVDNGVRYLMPLVADQRCLACHASAHEGATLGIIEVRQDFSGPVAKAHQQFLLWMLFISPLAIAAAGLVVWRVNHRIEQSIRVVDQAVTQVEAVADLRHLQLARHDLGFEELNRLFGHLGHLIDKLRSIAVDKDVLRFEISLLEKFVITSEVVRDWSDYIARLLDEINQVMAAPVLFSVFRGGEEMLELEIFWARPPTPETKVMVQDYVQRLIVADGRLWSHTESVAHHHIPSRGEPLVLDPKGFSAQIKSLLVDTPKIGGVVGIGVHAALIGEETFHLVTDSILATMLNVVGSVKAIHRYTRDMEYYATRDPLTDLYNRRVFWELFEYEVARARRHGYQFALLVVDLDNFKLVNDSFGHAAGDSYLQEVAQAMKRSLRPGDIFARYGGDEFVALLPEITADTAAVVAQRVLDAAAAVGQPGPDGRRVTGSVSIGLAVYPLHADNTKDLFLFADNMMYKAKEGGKRQVGVPDEQEVAKVFRDMTRTTMMVVAAVNEGRIMPFFQPIIAVGDGGIIGYEVLSRLQLEDAHLEANRFIEYAERVGVIHRLDTQILERALRVLAESGSRAHMFVNLSPRAMGIADFLANLKRSVANAGIDPAQIVFEITERDTVKNIAILERMVKELKMSGFKLAIDDFGSGFSSFQYLRLFPVDYVKIEGDFIVNIAHSDRDRAFVQTIWRLAADLGIQVIAEHVESAEILAVLREIGIEYAQGYYVGHPAPSLRADAPAA